MFLQKKAIKIGYYNKDTIFAIKEKTIKTKTTTII